MWVYTQWILLWIPVPPQQGIVYLLLLTFLPIFYCLFLSITLAPLSSRVCDMFDVQWRKCSPPFHYELEKFVFAAAASCCSWWWARLPRWYVLLLLNSASTLEMSHFSQASWPKPHSRPMALGLCQLTVQKAPWESSLVNSGPSDGHVTATSVARPHNAVTLSRHRHVSSRVALWFKKGGVSVTVPAESHTVPLPLSPSPSLSLIFFPVFLFLLDLASAPSIY